MGKENKKQPERLMVLRCANCARKLEQYYYMDATGDFSSGICELCMKFGTLGKYSFEPRRIMYRKARGGGGERSRAGGE